GERGQAGAAPRRRRGNRDQDEIDRERQRIRHARQPIWEPIRSLTCLGRRTSRRDGERDRRRAAAWPRLAPKRYASSAVSRTEAEGRHAETGSEIAAGPRLGRGLPRSDTPRARWLRR